MRAFMTGVLENAFRVYGLTLLMRNLLYGLTAKCFLPEMTAQYGNCLRKNGEIGIE